MKAREVERGWPGRVAGPSAGGAAGPPRGKAPRPRPPLPGSAGVGLSPGAGPSPHLLWASPEGDAGLSTSQGSRADEPSWNVL